MLIEGDIITAVAPDIDAPAGAQLVDAQGLLVTPGLIDLHVHVYPGLGDFCLPPDQVGVDSGVPTVDRRGDERCGDVRARA